MQMFAIAYFGMTDFTEIGRMTLKEFEIRKRAYLLRKIEREEEIHLQAWANRSIEATKKMVSISISDSRIFMTRTGD